MKTEKEFKTLKKNKHKNKKLKHHLIRVCGLCREKQITNPNLFGVSGPYAFKNLKGDAKWRRKHSQWPGYSC